MRGFSFKQFQVGNVPVGRTCQRRNENMFINISLSSLKQLLAREVEQIFSGARKGKKTRKAPPFAEVISVKGEKSCLLCRKTIFGEMGLRWICESARNSRQALKNGTVDPLL